MRKIIEKIKNHKWLAIISILIISGISFYFYKKNQTENIEVIPQTIVAEKGNIEISVSGIGQVHAGSQVDLQPQIAGDGLDITAVKVENNEEVKKDQVIAILDSSEAQKKSQEAELSYKSAAIKLKQTERRFRTKTKDDKYARQLEENSLAQSKISLNKAYEDLQDYIIKAPFDGTVTGLNVEAGDSISRSDVLASVITDDVKAIISLNEVDAAKVKVGNKASLTFDALDGVTAEGEVNKIDTIGEVEQGVVTYDVEISFDSPSEFLKPGMSVSVEIEIEKVEDVIVIPIDAVKTGRGDKSIVFIENENGERQRQEVETGLSDDVTIEIKSGITEGEKVFTITEITTMKNNFSKQEEKSSNNSGSIIPIKTGGNRRPK